MNSDIPDPESNSSTEPEIKVNDVPVEEITALEIGEPELELNLPENPALFELSLFEDEAEELNDVPGSETPEIAELELQEQSLRESIDKLQIEYDRLQQAQLASSEASLARMVQESVADLEQRKQALQITVDQLEKRRDRIREEMRKNFAGVSQEIAIRVQGFKDYLVGSLQDLAATAEQLDFPALEAASKPAEAPTRKAEASDRAPADPQFSESSFQATSKQIRGLLDKYRNRPDYYGPAWQLRRTFEPVHAQRVSNWFFTQGARGAVASLGSRLQNILVAAAVISILRKLYGDRLRTLILVNSPERLGEWRRGMQDCLGIARGDFSQDRGITLFEAPEPLAIKADRLLKEGQMPLIIIDETEDKVSLALLQFPLWLAFAPDPQKMSNVDDFGF